MSSTIEDLLIREVQRLNAVLTRIDEIVKIENYRFPKKRGRIKDDKELANFDQATNTCVFSFELIRSNTRQNEITNDIPCEDNFKIWAVTNPEKLRKYLKNFQNHPSYLLTFAAEACNLIKNLAMRELILLPLLKHSDKLVLEGVYYGLGSLVEEARYSWLLDLFKLD